MRIIRNVVGMATLFGLAVLFSRIAVS